MKNAEIEAMLCNTLEIQKQMVMGEPKPQDKRTWSEWKAVLTLWKRNLLGLPSMQTKSVSAAVKPGGS